MRIANGSLWYDFAPDLVEEALLLASERAPSVERARFVQEREAIAGIETVDIREQCFRDSDTRWVGVFGIAKPLELLLRGAPNLADEISGCVLQRVRTKTEERAVLAPSSEHARSVLMLSLRPETVLDEKRLSDLLRPLVRVT
jgi:hypothetical protein